MSATREHGTRAHDEEEGRRHRGAGIVVTVTLLLLVSGASLVVGAGDVSLGSVVTAFTDYQDTDAQFIVRESRVPRTVVALVAGAALGLAGALLQAFTRNPLADPGILGVDAGASLAVVAGVSWFGAGAAAGIVWLAMLGALAASVVVYLVGATGAAPATPEKLTLAGVAVAAACAGLSTALILRSDLVHDLTRFWGAGSVGRRDPDALLVCTLVIVAGIVIGLACSGVLNALALGEELGQSLGARVATTRVGVVVAVTMLAGGAVALVGPVGFVGLMVPHAVRLFTGPDQRWILPLSLLAGASLLVGADVLGRVILPSGEAPAGLVTAFIGAPVLIALARRRGMSSL